MSRVFLAENGNSLWGNGEGLGILTMTQVFTSVLARVPDDDAVLVDPGKLLKHLVKG